VTVPDQTQLAGVFETVVAVRTVPPACHPIQANPRRHHCACIAPPQHLRTLHILYSRLVPGGTNLTQHLNHPVAITRPFCIFPRASHPTPTISLHATPPIWFLLPLAIPRNSRALGKSSLTHKNTRPRQPINTRAHREKKGIETATTCDSTAKRNGQTSKRKGGREGKKEEEEDRAR
jgi:hypothetical protein